MNIDPKRVGAGVRVRSSQDARPTESFWEVHINGGRVPTGLEAVAWARRVEELGAGEIVLTSMDCDGTKDGYDLEITRAVSEAVGIPVVASGGAGKPEHLADAILLGKADAALAASIFHFGEYHDSANERGHGRPGHSRAAVTIAICIGKLAACLRNWQAGSLPPDGDKYGHSRRQSGRRQSGRRRFQQTRPEAPCHRRCGRTAPAAIGAQGTRSWRSTSSSARW